MIFQCFAYSVIALLKTASDIFGGEISGKSKTGTAFLNQSRDDFADMFFIFHCNDIHSSEKCFIFTGHIKCYSWKLIRKYSFTNTNITQLNENNATSVRMCNNRRKTQLFNILIIHDSDYHIIVVCF